MFVVGLPSWETNHSVVAVGAEDARVLELDSVDVSAIDIRVIQTAFVKIRCSDNASDVVNRRNNCIYCGVIRLIYLSELVCVR